MQDERYTLEQAKRQGAVSYLAAMRLIPGLPGYMKAFWVKTDDGEILIMDRCGVTRPAVATDMAYLLKEKQGR
jgi:hypothetical protein